MLHFHVSFNESKTAFWGKFCEVDRGYDLSGTFQALQKAQSIERELRSLIDEANAPIFGVDVNGNVNEWNKKAQEITGYSPVEVLGKHLVQEFITPEYRKSVEEVFDDALCERSQASAFEFPIYTKHDARVDILLNATTRRDESGQVVGVMGVGHDITEERKVIRVA